MSLSEGADLEEPCGNFTMENDDFSHNWLVVFLEHDWIIMIYSGIMMDE